MSFDLGNDVTYPMRGVDFISFQVPSSDVLGLRDVLFVPRLKKNLLSVSCMADHQWRVAFEGQHCNISDYSLASPRNL
jgi:hypothetical protein